VLRGLARRFVLPLIASYYSIRRIIAPEEQNIPELFARYIYISQLAQTLGISKLSPIGGAPSE